MFCDLILIATCHFFNTHDLTAVKDMSEVVFTDREYNPDSSTPDPTYQPDYKPQNDYKIPANVEDVPNPFSNVSRQLSREIGANRGNGYQGWCEDENQNPIPCK